MTFSEIVGATLGLVGMILVGWAVIVQHSDTALGIAGTVVSMAAGYFLRAKVQPSSEIR